MESITTTPRINSLGKKLHSMELNREMKLKFFVYIRRNIWKLLKPREKGKKNEEEWLGKLIVME